MSHLEKLRKSNRILRPLAIVAAVLCFGGEYLYEAHLVSQNVSIVLAVTGLCVIWSAIFVRSQVMKGQ